MIVSVEQTDTLRVTVLPELCVSVRPDPDSTLATVTGTVLMVAEGGIFSTVQQYGIGHMYLEGLLC